MRTARDIDGLRAKLGIIASDAPRLEEALTHGSVNQTGGPPVKSNVTLAFVGDAVIELAVRDRMLNDRQDALLGELSTKSDEDVRNERLAERARTIQLGDYIDLGKGAQTERGPRQGARHSVRGRHRGHLPRQGFPDGHEIRDGHSQAVMRLGTSFGAQLLWAPQWGQDLRLERTSPWKPHWPHRTVLGMVVTRPRAPSS